MLVFRSDALLPKVPRPVQQTPSAHRPFVDSHPDSAEFNDLSYDYSDGGAALAEDLKGKAVESLGRGESPEADAGTSCPKKPRAVVRKRRASIDARLLVGLFLSYSELAV